MYPLYHNDTYVYSLDNKFSSNKPKLHEQRFTTEFVDQGRYVVLHASHQIEKCILM